jgi:hypothetical protein
MDNNSVVFQRLHEHSLTGFINNVARSRRIEGGSAIAMDFPSWLTSRVTLTLVKVYRTLRGEGNKIPPLDRECWR